MATADDRFADPDAVGGPAAFAGRAPWLARRVSLRNTVRQHLVRRRLAELGLGDGATALDVGAGQGTQAIGLARQGVRVVALEPDRAMRAACRTALADEPVAVRERVEVVAGGVDDLPPGRGERPFGVLAATFDLVACHGVLLYLSDPRRAVARLADRVGPGGALSILTRNAAAVPVRPLLRGRWDDVAAALYELDRAATTGERPRYRNELGVEAHADDVHDVIAWVDGRGDWTHAWTGVRLASDALDADQPLQGDDDLLGRLVDLEERLGRTDPYRRLASLFHLVSRRTVAGG